MENKNRVVKVSDKELEKTRRFFNDNYGSKVDCERRGFTTMPTLWRFLNTGKARPDTIKSIRRFVKEYEPATI